MEKSLNHLSKMNDSMLKWQKLHNYFKQYDLYFCLVRQYCNVASIMVFYLLFLQNND